MLQQAVKSFPPGTSDLNYAYALFNLGKSLRLAGRPDEAIPVLEQRLKIPNQTGTVQQELELAKQQAGEGSAGQLAAEPFRQLHRAARSPSSAAALRPQPWVTSASAVDEGWSTEPRLAPAGEQGERLAQRDRPPAGQVVGAARPAAPERRDDAARHVVHVGEVARRAGRRVPGQRLGRPRARDPAGEGHVGPLAGAVDGERPDDHRVAPAREHGRLGGDLARGVRR